MFSKLEEHNVKGQYFLKLILSESVIKVNGTSMGFKICEECIKIFYPPYEYEFLKGGYGCIVFFFLFNLNLTSYPSKRL